MNGQTVLACHSIIDNQRVLADCYELFELVNVVLSALSRVHGVSEAVQNSDTRFAVNNFFDSRFFSRPNQAGKPLTRRFLREISFIFRGFP